MENNLNNFDDLFREELSGYSETPPPAVWQALEKRLEGDKRRRAFPLRWWWYFSIISFVTLLGASIAWKSARFAEFTGGLKPQRNTTVTIESKPVLAVADTRTGKPDAVDHDTKTPSPITSHANKKATEQADITAKTTNHIKKSTTRSARHTKAATHEEPAIVSANAPATGTSIYSYDDFENEAPVEKVASSVSGEERSNNTYVVNRVKKHNMVAVDMAPVPEPARQHKADADIESNEEVAAAIPTSSNTGTTDALSADSKTKNKSEHIYATTPAVTTGNPVARKRKKKSVSTATAVTASVATTGAHAIPAIADKAMVYNSAEADKAGQLTNTATKTTKGVTAKIAASPRPKAAAMPAGADKPTSSATANTFAASTAGTQHSKEPAPKQPASSRNAAPDRKKQDQVVVAVSGRKEAKKGSDAAVPTQVATAATDQRAVVAAVSSTDRQMPEKAEKKKKTKTDKLVGGKDASAAKKAGTAGRNASEVGLPANKEQTVAVDRTAKVKEKKAADQRKGAKPAAASVTNTKHDATTTISPTEKEYAAVDGGIKTKEKKGAAERKVAAITEGIGTKNTKQNSIASTEAKPGKSVPKPATAPMDKTAVAGAKVAAANEVIAAKPAQGMPAAYKPGKASATKKNTVGAPADDAEQADAATSKPAVQAAKTEEPKKVADVSKPETNKDTGANEQKQDSTSDDGLSSMMKLVFGIKGGFESGANKQAGNKLVVSPYVQYKLSDKFSLMVQPAIKGGALSKKVIGSPANYYTVKPGTGSYSFVDSTPIILAGGGMLWEREYKYTEKFDSVVKTNSIGGFYMEVELPLLLQYKLTDRLSVYGGVNAIYSKQFRIKESTATFSDLTATGSPYTILPYNAPAVLPNTTGITYTGNPLASYTGPAYAADQGSLFRMGYMLGLSYEVKPRWMADILVQQAFAKQNIQGGYNINNALSMPYVRLTLGYRITK